jgi:hypothetical protein
MPCINFPIEPIGPVLEIGLSKAKAFTTEGETPPIVWAKAIADTGCTTTSVHTGLAQSAGLQVVGKANVLSTTHTVPANLYLGNLYLEWTLLNGSVINMTFPDQQFLELHQCSPHHQALLGMNVLGIGQFSINGMAKLATFCW